MTTHTSQPASESGKLKFRFDLPPFPTTASRLVAELNNANAKVSEVTQLIECEPMIGSKVISLANNMVFGSRSISTISHAIVILGFKSVARLSLTVATGSVFDGGASCLESRKQTYRQSLAVATLARRIASETGLVNPDEAFLTGVVHDIGKLVLFDAAGESYAEMLDANPVDQITGLELETYGATHPELGKQCGKNWGLPHTINTAINNHHIRRAK